MEDQLARGDDLQQALKYSFCFRLFAISSLDSMCQVEL